MKSISLRITFSFFLLPFFFLLLFTPLTGDEDFLIEKDVSFSPDIYESLEELKEHPLDLNNSSYEELTQIPYITPDLAFRIEDYRKNNYFNKINDLLNIAGFNKPLIKRISPYIIIKQKPIKASKKMISSKTTMSVRYPADEQYSSSPLKISNKIKFRINQFTLGGTTFKGAYERNYIDFYTLFLFYDTNDLKFILGDYAFDIGERLVMGYPGFTFKSSGVIKGKENTIKPYVSGFEDFSLRGFAVEKTTPYFSIGLFASYKPLDATVDNDTVKKVIYETGYHRTETEIGKKDRIVEKLIGGTVRGGTNNFKIRTTSLYAEYDNAVIPDSSSYYRFRGKKYDLSGVHIQFNKNRISFWSEFAFNITTKGVGFVAGMSSRPKKVTISILFREYSETFYSPRAFSFCESEPRNERGFYTYISSKLPYSCDFSGYIDIFTRLNPTYFNQFSINGYEAFSSIERKIKKSFLYVRYKRKEKEGYQWEDKSLLYVRQNLRLSLKTELTHSSEFKILWEGIEFCVPEIEKHEKGNLFALSFKSNIFNRSSYEVGMVLFETDSYYSRIYIFLNDIPGSMNTRSFFGKGSDFYALMKGKINDNLRIYGKFDFERKDETSNRTYKFGVEWR